ncbi:hypothetical protein ACFV0D_29635 [Streptomyces sp. NPDC059556]|uniref:hypothetical protein n=1 Tax=Streptomyces sp. NPDC059556 TaxID=3346863 RepID=UPI003687137A
MNPTGTNSRSSRSRRTGVPVVITAPIVERAERGAASRGRRRPASTVRRVGVRQSAFDAAA